uniref:Secreted protein n=1 Tax=Opuntia streptacantha TaxID=393608 RepID=A0A7C8Z8I2_OPUST
MFLWVLLLCLINLSFATLFQMNLRILGVFKLLLLLLIPRIRVLGGSSGSSMNYAVCFLCFLMDQKGSELLCSNSTITLSSLWSWVGSASMQKAQCFTRSSDMYRISFMFESIQNDFCLHYELKR